MVFNLLILNFKRLKKRYLIKRNGNNVMLITKKFSGVTIVL